jgi:PAS domain S-box-containing protein
MKCLVELQPNMELIRNRCTSWNKGAEEVYGYSAEDIIGKPISIISPSNSDTEAHDLTQKIKRGERVSHYETTRLRKDGTLINVSLSLSPVFDIYGKLTAISVIARDITQSKNQELERDMSMMFLQLMNVSKGTTDLVHSVVSFFREFYGFEVVGIRLKNDYDYPYYEASGFPEKFVMLENSLCALNDDGKPICDSAGYPIQECMCGNVICGRFDASMPFFSNRGSFWTNSTTELLATTSEADRQARTRNRCNGEGYESVALISLHMGEERIGLIQLNDKRKGMFSLEMISMFERLADYLVVALSKTRTEEALREAYEKLQAQSEELELAYCSLKESERGLAEAQQMAHIGNWDRNLINGEVYWSDEMHRIYCHNPQEPVTTFGEIFIYVHPDDRAYMNNAVKEAFNGKPFSIDHRIVLTNGEERIVQAKGEVVFDEQNNPVRIKGTTQDITVRVKAEKALQKSEEQYRTLFNSMNEGFSIIEMLFDENEKPIDYIFVENNPAFER